MPKDRSRTPKKLLPKLHIYCEGAKTEPNYLNGYISNNYPGNVRLKIIEIVPTKKNTPKQLVDEAVWDKKHKYPEGDFFWVVYDRESKYKYSDKLHMEAYQKAKNNNVNIGLSNVCFELWLLLHFQDTYAPYSCCDDLIKNSSLHAECKKLGLSSYSKGDKYIFNKIDNLIGKARERAEKMNMDILASADPFRVQPYHLNPYTDVHKLLDAIDKFAKDNIR